jgi:hypothetical protein
LAVTPTRSIYRAQHDKLQREVRIELFAAEFGESHFDYVRRTFAAAAATQGIRNVHVATVIDLGRLPDCYYIMTDQHPSRLRDLMRPGRRMPVQRALRIAEDVLVGLQAVHEAGLVHGNVTPDGILLGYDDAAILDHMGTATWPEDAERLTLTDAGSLTGPALYAAPERSDSDGEPDIRADLYSLGCTLFEMVAGRPPHVAGSPEELQAMRVSGRTPDLADICPNAPRALSAFIARLIAQDVQARPATPDEALAELRELAAELSRRKEIGPIKAALEDGGRRGFDVKWNLTWTVVAVVLAFITILPFSLLWTLHRSRERAAVEPPPRVGNTVLLFVRPAPSAAQERLTDGRRRAVLHLMQHQLSFAPGFEPVQADIPEGRPPEGIMADLGADYVFGAVYAPGFNRRKWTVAWGTRGDRTATVAQEAAIDAGSDDLAPLEAAARAVLATAAGRLALPPVDTASTVGGTEADWLEFGRALQAEREGRWADVRIHAATAARDGAGIPAAALLAGLSEAVLNVSATGNFSLPAELPHAGLPAEMAAISAVLPALETGDEAAIEERFGTLLAHHQESARGYFLLGLWRLHGQGKPQEAILALKHAVKLDTGYMPAARLCVEALVQARPAEVDAFLSDYAQRQPDAATAASVAEYARQLLEDAQSGTE